jgi:hypothetical protein
MEVAMNGTNDFETITLPRRSVHRIVDGRGLQITVLAGTAWITQQNDRRDVILPRGQSFLLDRPGLALVMALQDLTITVGLPGAVELPPARRRPVKVAA